MIEYGTDINKLRSEYNDKLNEVKSVESTSLYSKSIKVNKPTRWQIQRLCNHEQLIHRIQICVDGTQHLRLCCAKCDKYFKFVRQNSSLSESAERSEAVINREDPC